MSTTVHPWENAIKFAELEYEGEERLVVMGAAGDSWTAVGAAPGTTKQAASQRFGKGVH